MVYALVQLFEPAPDTMKKQNEGHMAHVPDKDIELFRVKRRYLPDKKREARIVPLTDIWRAIELVPLFGEACPQSWNTTNAIETAKEFFVNSFLDKDTYHCVY